MKKRTNKAVSTTAVKVENKNEATIDTTISSMTDEVANKNIPQHITEEDPEWNDYIVGLKKNIEDSIDAGIFNFYTAYVGFIDDEDQSFANIYDSEKMFRTLIANGYCPDCSRNYIELFKNEKDDKGKNKHYVIISKDEQDFYSMEEEYYERLSQTKIKHTK